METLNDILKRFHEGKGATLTYGTADDPAVFRRVFLIPQPVFDEGAGLLVVVENEGSLLWNGNVPVTKFQLVARGIRGLGFAEKLATVLNGIRDAYMQKPKEIGFDYADTAGAPAPSRPSWQRPRDSRGRFLKRADKPASDERGGRACAC